MNKFSRRDFLRMGMGVAGSVGLGVFGSTSKGLAAQTEVTTALVVGSGFGGAIAALRLAEAGIPTIVLERGRRWDIQPDGDTFATFENADERSSWLTNCANGLFPECVEIDRYTGVLEQIFANNMTVTNGAGVGGGSLAYNAIIVAPRRDVWLQNFPAALGIDFDEMNDVYFPRVRQMINASPIPEDILATPYYASTRASQQQALNAGFSVRQIDYGIDWNIVRQEIDTLENNILPGQPGYARPSAIAGQSWYGLNSGAKTSVDQNYLKLAEQSGYVQVLPLHVVKDITQSGYGDYIVSANQIDTSGNVIATKNFVCRYLFLAAGSLGTSELLVRAKAKGTLPNLRTNAAIGRYWGSNGDFLAYRVFDATDPTHYTFENLGGPCGHIYVEDRDNAIAETGLIELVVPYPLTGSGVTLNVGMSSIGPAAGWFSYNAVTDTVTLNWPAVTDSVLAAFVASAEQLSQTLDAKNPGSLTPFFSTEFTAHPVGGVVLGKACNSFGRVNGQARLYVVDGAMIPVGSLGVNPSLTIGALAERNMERIIATDIFGVSPPSSR